MDRVRAQLNRVVIVAALVILMPVVVVADKLRRGAGRSIAIASFRAAARACGVRFEACGIDQLVEGERYIFVANHSSPLDLVAAFLFRPQARIMAAGGLFRVPVVGPAMRAIGAFPIDRRRPQVARQQLAALVRTADPTDLIICPEGAIPPKGQRLPFKMGAFALAIATDATIVPVALHHTDDLLPRHGRLLVRPGVVRTEFLTPICTRHLTNNDREALRDRARNAIVHALETNA